MTFVWWKIKHQNKYKITSMQDLIMLLFNYICWWILFKTWMAWYLMISQNRWTETCAPTSSTLWRRLQHLFGSIRCLRTIYPRRSLQMFGPIHGNGILVCAKTHPREFHQFQHVQNLFLKALLSTPLSHGLRVALNKRRPSRRIHRDGAGTHQLVHIDARLSLLLRSWTPEVAIFTGHWGYNHY